ncbi:hypothetical protein C8A01DRAFT_50885 [Parachaetomium inaequale]|uniref:Uncharacterized protein n=1 Tax=Parachaetomium inaequale TaxID=2588326 RepID=A0AAN6SM17_9PEZI|nr:hypothetical protein C8A01DRAFT_50885 [Parachaetomium inaequale]
MASTQPSREAPTTSSDDDDPVVANYSVFIKPTLPEHRNLVVLQYVNKTAQDPAQIRVPRIAELRMKPSTGMYEVDVPIDTAEAYDRNKGVAWGSALQKSMEAKKGGSLGLAGGFNMVATSTTARGRRGGGGGGAGASTDDEPPLNWAEAARQDKVLRTQTFGGGRSAEEESTRHMIENLHLTPVSSVVHLRPVPHHLDAATEQERLTRGGSAATANSGGAPEKPGAGATAGRAIHMTIKSAMDADGGVATETMADRLRNVQTETWQRMEWVHDEAEMAWEAYNECLLLRSSGAANNHNNSNAAQEEGGGGEGGEGENKAKGKGKEKEIEAAGDESGAADLVDKVSRLRTDWGEQELLQAGKEAVVKTEERPAEGQKQAGRAGRGAAAASAAAGATGTRKSTRRGATRGNAMEID